VNILGRGRVGLHSTADKILVSESRSTSCLLFVVTSFLSIACLVHHDRFIVKQLNVSKKIGATTN